MPTKTLTAETNKMATATVAYIKGSELPDRIAKKYQINPDQTFKITIEAETDKERQWREFFETVADFHEKMKDEAPEELEALIEEAVSETRKQYAQDNY